MSTRELTCIGCPLGCALTVEMDGNKVVGVTGHTCPRGKAYAENISGVYGKTEKRSFQKASDFAHKLF